MIETLLLNLQSRDLLSKAEQDILRDTILRNRKVAAGEDLVTEGSRPDFSTLILDGFAARYKVTAEGNRQITALHVAGDFVDLHAFPLRKMDHGIVAMSECHVAYADHAALKTITETAPHLTRLLWMQTLIDGAIHREWIVAMGRRSRKSHIAHLICELFVRLRVVKKTDGWSFFFPLTQAATADALGISLVHLNKTLQKLRKEDLFRWENRTIVIEDWEGLQQVAEFDSSYLNLSVEPR